MHSPTSFRYLFSFVTAVLAATNTTASVPQSGPVYGRNVTYTGFYNDTVEGFLGIRFAQDTGGQHRFKPPRPYLPPAGSVLQAIHGGPACPQQAASKNAPPSIFSSLGGGPPAEISEDCLRLNVWRPAGTTAGRGLPVLVWIYGGGFTAGSKDETNLYPTELIHQSVLNGHPIMHVELNYRLGVFGFAHFETLTADGSANAGLRDQRLALEWVKDNIAAFGGDPSQVTIHGQSSGGLAVGMQILAHGGKKPVPFQQAICQSQALEPGITGSYTKKATANVVKALKCSIMKTDSAASVACLRGASMKELLDAQLSTASKENLGDIWLPTVDGASGFLPEAPSKLIQEGRFANVKTMIGWCEDDGSRFVPTITNGKGTEEFAQSYLPGFSKKHITHLLSLYPASEFRDSLYPNGSIAYPAQQHRAARILRDIVFTCQPISLGSALAKAGNDVYLYAQNKTLYTPLLEKAGLYGYGVIHTSELGFIFGNTTNPELKALLQVTPAEIKLAMEESRSWSSFTATGSPSTGDGSLQGWERANFGDQNYGIYVIGGSNAGYAGSDGDQAAKQALAAEKLQARCEFLNRPEIIKELQY